MYRILVIEDEPLISLDIKRSIAKLNMLVVGIAYNGDQALDLLYNRKPDLVLLDINLGGTLDGIEVAEIINSKYNIPFIYLTSFADKKTLERAKLTMPYGYIVKPFDKKELFAAIELAIFKHKKDVSSSKMDHFDMINLNLNNPLTKKEITIARLLISGCSNAEIAQKEFISLNTVKSHIKNLYQKLEVHSRAELVYRILHNHS